MMTWLNVMMARVLCGCRKMMKDERGDTNFVSIIIILGIVVALVAAFAIFRDKILGVIEEIINGFSAKDVQTSVH